MKFGQGKKESKPQRDGHVVWESENGLYRLESAEHEVHLEYMDSRNKGWMMRLPVTINIIDSEVTAFVVRGLMEALEVIPESLDDKDLAVTAVKQFMDDLCDEEDKDTKRTRYHSQLDRMEILLDMGEQRIYTVRREYIRRYLANKNKRGGDGVGS